ncbi:MAG TPA: bifunctional shikimate kinase/3-dehydroquinate synthase [Gaiellaceae bacterium]|nr:bifunctional shikimate kinase/3-dehydroquinate synthase [Gaiellaceae bacterium]
MVSEVGALGKHLALIGFMGAGKSTIGRELARLTHRPFVDTDAEIERLRGPIPELFERGEPEFRRIEEQVVAEALVAPLSVIALGGGAVLSEVTRERLDAHAFCVFLDVDVDSAWERVRGSDRPLAQREEDFRQLYETRLPLYHEVTDAPAKDVEDVLLATLHIFVGGKALLGPSYVVVADEQVLALHPFDEGGRIITVPPGEQAKASAVVERLWRDFELGRDGMIVAIGGGSTTDVAGFAAATYKRGLRWTAIPTTLTGMVDAAIGGKTGINTADGKNLVGAFHFPRGVFIQARYLGTLPDEERRAGMAEVVKTGLLVGREVWSLPDEEMIRACAAFKAGVVLSDPYETEGGRTILNLGHTFAHALEAGSGYRVRHGDAVALGLLAALRLSGQPTDAVEEVLRPRPVAADPDAAWAALKRDKKGEGVFVLLERPGEPVVTSVADKDARAALEALIAK